MWTNEDNFHQPTKVFFIDNDYTRMTWVYFMRERSEVFKTFKRFKNLVQNQHGKKIKVIKR